MLWVPVLSKVSNWDLDLFFNRKFSALEMVCVCVCESLSHVWLFAIPWTVALQAPLSMGFSRQEYRSRLPFPSPGDLPDPGTEPGSPTLQADFFYHWAAREAKMFTNHLLNLLQPILGAYLSNTHAYISVVWNRLARPLPKVKQTPKSLYIFALLSLSFCYHSHALPFVFIMYCFNYSILLLWTLHR